MYFLFKKIKAVTDELLKPHLFHLNRYNILPHHLTILSIIFSGVGAIYLFNKPLVGVPLILGYLILDFLDGALARVTDNATKHGAQLDFLE